MTTLLTSLASVPALHTLAADDTELKFLVIGGGLALAALIMVLNTLRKVTDVKERERSRREVAAYVAEGSLTPDDAARILSAGLNEAVAQEVARGVTWGMVSAGKAQKLVQALNQQTPAVAPPSPAQAHPPR